MDRIVINDFELLVKNAEKVVIVTNEKVLIVDVETSSVTDASASDIAITKYGVETLLQGTIDMALGALYNRGY